MTEMVNPEQTLDVTGFPGIGTVNYNLREPALVQASLRLGEGTLGIGGALLVATGRHTGRSPKDKFIVREPGSESKIWWGEVNRPIARALRIRLASDSSPTCGAARPVRPGSPYRRRPGPSPPQCAGQHRDRLARASSRATCSAGPTAELAAFYPNSPSRSSARLVQGRPGAPRARAPTRRSPSTSSGWRSSSSAPSTPARSRRAPSRS